MSGPLAFPQPSFDGMGHGDNPAETGMTLRDWFAGQVLPSIAAMPLKYPEWQLKAWFGDRSGIRNEQIIARAAYDIADSMLAARGEA